MESVPGGALVLAFLHPRHPQPRPHLVQSMSQRTLAHLAAQLRLQSPRRDGPFPLHQRKGVARQLRSLILLSQGRRLARGNAVPCQRIKKRKHFGREQKIGLALITHFKRRPLTQQPRFQFSCAWQARITKCLRGQRQVGFGARASAHPGGRYYPWLDGKFQAQSHFGDEFGRGVDRLDRTRAIHPPPRPPPLLQFLLSHDEDSVYSFPSEFLVLRLWFLDFWIRGNVSGHGFSRAEPVARRYCATDGDPELVDGSQKERAAAGSWFCFS